MTTIWDNEEILSFYNYFVTWEIIVQEMKDHIGKLLVFFVIKTSVTLQN